MRERLPKNRVESLTLVIVLSVLHVVWISNSDVTTAGTPLSPRDKGVARKSVMRIPWLFCLSLCTACFKLGEEDGNTNYLTVLIEEKNSCEVKLEQSDRLFCNRTSNRTSDLQGRTEEGKG